MPDIRSTQNALSITKLISQASRSRRFVGILNAGDTIRFGHTSLTLYKNSNNCLFLRNPKLGIDFSLLSGINTIGRGLDQHLVLRDAKVSREHASLIVSRDGTVRVFDHNPTNPSVIKGSMPRYVEPTTKDIIAHLRNDNRPSLVGIVKGLTRNMEKAFRSGVVSLTRDYHGQVCVMNSDGGETTWWSPDKNWHLLGFEHLPTEQERSSTYNAYEEWVRLQVYFGEKNDPALAMKHFQNKFGDPCGIRLLNIQTANDVYYVMDLLSLIPGQTLKNSVNIINFSASRDRSARYAQYKEETKEIGLIRNCIRPDKYLLTGLLLHEMGHAVMHSMNEDQITRLRDLYKRFWNNNNVLGVDFLMVSARDRIRYQYNTNDPDEFAAENFMHFLVFGRQGFIARSRNKALTAELCGLFEELYGEKDFDALEVLAKA